MALTKTTLAAAVAQADIAIVVTSATGFAAGNLVSIDGEYLQVSKNYVSGTTIPVQRGIDGTVQTTHKSGANVNTFLASDQAGASPQTYTQSPSVRARRLLSYSATGAITMPAAGEDMVAVLNGTSTLAMTLANPTTDMDGCNLYILSNGKGAHTVTYSAGVGNGGATMDVATYNTTEATGCALMALNGFWVLWANGIGAATGQVAGVSFG